MPRLLPAFLGLSLLLSACNKPVVVPANDPNILSGQWAGKVVQQRNIQAVYSTDSRVYFKDSDFIEGDDLATGRRLGVLHLPASSSGSDVMYRDDGVFVYLDMYAKKLYKFDAATFQQLSADPVTDQGDMSLSRDGNLLYSFGASGPRQSSTRTGQPIPFTYVNGMSTTVRSSDNRWWLAYSGFTSKDTAQIFRTADGVGFDAAPQHPAVANCTPSFLWPNVESVYLPTGEERLLLAYPDGVLETRDTAGKLLHAFALGNCNDLSLKTFPGKTGIIAFTTKVTSGIFDVASRQILRTGAFQSLALLLPNGTISFKTPAADASDTSGSGNQPTVTFTPLGGAAWNLSNVSHTLSLDVTSTFITKNRAEIGGTALVDGRTMKVSGQLTTQDAEIQAQSGWFFFPTFHVALNFFDGSAQLYSATLTNRLSTRYAPGDSETPLLDTSVPPRYDVDWQEAGSTVVRGSLIRP